MKLVTLASGSRGNCALLSDGSAHILIDAGISARRIRENLDACGLKISELSAILISHEHSDHISGLKTLLKYNKIPVFAPRTVSRAIACTIAGVEASLHEISTEDDFMLGSLQISAFPTMHDTAQSVGYRISGSSVFALATDTGCVTTELYGGLKGADCVLIECNHDLDMLKYGTYPVYLKRRILADTGHLSNDACAALAKDLALEGTKNIILGHLSRENNTPQKAFAAVSQAIAGLGATLSVAPPDARLTVSIGERKVCCL